MKKNITKKNWTLTEECLYTLIKDIFHRVSSVLGIISGEEREGSSVEKKNPFFYLVVHGKNYHCNVIPLLKYRVHTSHGTLVKELKELLRLLHWYLRC